MAGLGDILTSAQNIAVAINGWAHSYVDVNGSSVSSGMTAATVVKTSPGRICTVSVIVAGAATGTIYDAVNASSTSNPIYTIPTTAGAFVVNIPTQFGIVVKPGTGQTITVSFS